VIYRMGFASSRDQARQLVTHGHFRVNGRKCGIPSRRVKPGDEITLNQGSDKTTFFENGAAFDSQRAQTPQWLQVDQKAMTGRVMAVPQRSDVDALVTEQLIVEYYSR
ncbi:MAG TPA: 30S ribosomal protein S4, partial [Chloroflexota bacterium]